MLVEPWGSVFRSPHICEPFQNDGSLIRNFKGRQSASSAPSCHALADQMGDPMGQGHGLSSAGAGHHNKVVPLVENGGALLRVQGIKDWISWRSKIRGC